MIYYWMKYWSRLWEKYVFLWHSHAILIRATHLNAVAGAPAVNLPPEYTQSASDDEPVESKTKTMAPHQLAHNSGPTQNGISYFFSLSVSLCLLCLGR